MPHAGEEFADTPLWNAVDAAIGELLGSGDLQLATSRAHVVGYLCARLVAGGFGVQQERAESMTAARFADFLEQAAAAGIGGAEWSAQMTARHADARVEEARRQAALIGLRVDQGGLAAEQAAMYLRALAKGLRER